MAFGNGLDFTVGRATLLVVLAADDNDLLISLVLHDACKRSLLLHLGDALLGEGGDVQPPDLVLLSLVGVEADYSTQEVDVVVGVSNDGTAVLGLLGVGEAGGHLGLESAPEVNGLELVGGGDGQPLLPALD